VHFGTGRSGQGVRARRDAVTSLQHAPKRAERSCRGMAVLVGVPQASIGVQDVQTRSSGCGRTLDFVCRPRSCAAGTKHLAGSPAERDPRNLRDLRITKVRTNRLRSSCRRITPMVWRMQAGLEPRLCMGWKSVNRCPMSQNRDMGHRNPLAAITARGRGRKGGEHSGTGSCGPGCRTRTGYCIRAGRRCGRGHRGSVRWRGRGRSSCRGRGVGRR